CEVGEPLICSVWTIGALPDLSEARARSSAGGDAASACRPRQALNGISATNGYSGSRGWAETTERLLGWCSRNEPRLPLRVSAGFRPDFPHGTPVEFG